MSGQGPGRTTSAPAISSANTGRPSAAAETPRPPRGVAPVNLAPREGSGDLRTHSRGVIRQRTLRTSAVTELQRLHDLVEVTGHAPLKTLRQCAGCEKPVQPPEDRNYLLCRRCMQPTHLGCRDKVGVLHCCDQDNVGNSVMLVDDLGAALADKFHKIGALDTAITQCTQDAKQLGLKESDKRALETKKVQLRRERAGLLAQSVVAEAKASSAGQSLAKREDRWSLSSITMPTDLRRFFRVGRG